MQSLTVRAVIKRTVIKKRGPKPHRNHSDKPVAEKTGSYTTTYKADFKPQQHKAEYKNLKIILQVTVMNLKVKNKSDKIVHSTIFRSSWSQT